MKYHFEDYIRFDPFEGDRDTDVKMRTVKLIKARAEHPCWMGLSPDSSPHVIKQGEMARFEKARVEGDWCQYYVCIQCMDNWLDETNVTENKTEENKYQCSFCTCWFPFVSHDGNKWLCDSCFYEIHKCRPSEY